MQPEGSGVKTWQWVVTAVVIIVLIIIGIMVWGNKGSTTTPATTAETGSNSGTTATTAGVNRITMTDQYPGNVVYISSVQLANPGWVVIKNDSNGQPGDVIGSAYAPSGINPVKITLTSPTVDGDTYYAILYTGNNSTSFDPTAEQPLTDSTGNVIMYVFHASSSVNESLKG